MKRVKLFLFLILFAFVFSVTPGCSNEDVIKTGWKSLAVSATVYSTVMNTSGKLYREGKLSEEKKETLVNMGKIYTGSYNVAVDTLVQYEKAVSEDANSANTNAMKVCFQVAVGTLKDNLFSLIDNYNLIVTGIEGVTKIEKPGV